MIRADAPVAIGEELLMLGRHDQPARDVSVPTVGCDLPHRVEQDPDPVRVACEKRWRLEESNPAEGIVECGVGSRVVEPELPYYERERVSRCG